MSRTRTATSPVRLLVLASLLLAATALGGCGDDEPVAFAGIERSPTPEVGDLSLPAVEADGSATPFEFRAGQGHLLLVYFGYTSCPDVCPTTLSDVRRVTDRFTPEEAERIDLAMITIDPGVDTPDVLTGYVRSFIPEATAIWTENDGELRSVAEAFGADYGQAEGEDGQPEVFHTGSLYAVDGRGRLRLTWPFGITPDDLERDLSRLLDEGAA
jgi:protein SCO1/2